MPSFEIITTFNIRSETPKMSSKIPTITKSSNSTQAHLLPSTSSVTVTLSPESQPPIPLTDTAPALSNSLSISAASSSSTVSMSTPLQACPILETTTTTSNTIPATSQDAKTTSKPRRKKRPPKKTSDTIKPKIEIKTAPHKPRKLAPGEYTTDEEDMVVYDVEDELESKEQKPEIEIKMTPHTSRKIYYRTEDLIVYEVEQLEEHTTRSLTPTRYRK
ncbi:hypothetical protein TNCV_1864181 [Trichonephila clavipes]|nr:hypothetical protein TNCV_1864181 [Trichonephila clavipes]